jgi:hypothetical protein
MWTYMGGGGGGGSSYSESGTATGGSGETPGGSGHTLYDGSAGEGGIPGDWPTIPSTPGEGGLVVITY